MKNERKPFILARLWLLWWLAWDGFRRNFFFLDFIFTFKTTKNAKNSVSFPVSVCVCVCSPLLGRAGGDDGTCIIFYIFHLSTLRWEHTKNVKWNSRRKAIFRGWNGSCVPSPAEDAELNTWMASELWLALGGACNMHEICQHIIVQNIKSFILGWLLLHIILYEDIRHISYFPAPKLLTCRDTTHSVIHSVSCHVVTMTISMRSLFAVDAWNVYLLCVWQLLVIFGNACGEHSLTVPRERRKLLLKLLLLSLSTSSSSLPKNVQNYYYSRRWNRNKFVSFSSTQIDVSVSSSMQIIRSSHRCKGRCRIGNRQMRGGRWTDGWWKNVTTQRWRRW